MPEQQILSIPVTQPVTLNGKTPNTLDLLDALPLSYIRILWDKQKQCWLIQQTTCLTQPYFDQQAAIRDAAWRAHNQAIALLLDDDADQRSCRRFASDEGKLAKLALQQAAEQDDNNRYLFQPE